MRLSEWMNRQGLSDDQVAEKVGSTRVAVGYWRTGQRFPEPKRLHAFEVFTKGEVTASDFLADWRVRNGIPAPRRSRAARAA
jgi:transcriptional regulator with XRE-family HTH domain